MRSIMRTEPRDAPIRTKILDARRRRLEQAHDEMAEHEEPNRQRNRP